MFNDTAAVTSKGCALFVKSSSMTPNFRVGPDSGLFPHNMRSSRVADRGLCPDKGHQDIAVPRSDYDVPRIETLYPGMPKFVHKKIH